MTDEEDNIESDMTNDSYNSSFQQSNIESMNEGRQFNVKLSGMITSNRYLEQQIRQHVIQINECHRQINELKEGINRYKTQVQRRHQTQNNRIVEITEENGHLKAEIALHRINSLMCAKPEDTEAIRDEEMNRLNELIKELQNTIKNLSTARTSSENSMKKTEADHLEMIDKYKDENESLKSRYSKEHKGFMIESNGYKAQVRQLIQDNQVYCREIQEHKDKNTTLEKNNFKFAQEQRMYQQAIQRVNNDHQNLQLRFNEIAKQKQDKDESFEQLFKVYEEKRQQSEVLQSAKGQNENEINKLVAEVCSYQESLQAKEDELIKMKETIRLSQEQMLIYANDYEREEHEKKVLERELANTKRELERMRDEFTRRQQEQVHGYMNHQPREHHYNPPQQYPPGARRININ